MNQTPHDKQKLDAINALSEDQTADLLSKASKVSTWMTALKHKSELRPHIGISEDESVIVTIRSNRIASIRTREDIAQKPLADIIRSICEAHNDAVDKMEAWTCSEYEKISKTLGIDGDFKLPF